MTATRGRAPWASGGRSVVRACSQVSTRASHSRAPWSRTSSTSPQSSVRPWSAGVGLVSGSRAALIWRRPPRSRGPGGGRRRRRPRRSRGTGPGGRRGPARRGPSRPSARRLGVDDVDQVAGGLGEVGGVQPAGLVEQGLLGQLPGRRVRGELLDGVQMIAGLLRGDRARRAARRGSADRSPTRSLACRTALEPVRRWVPASVGEPVAGRGPGELLLGDLAVLDLGQRGGLDRGQVGAQRLALGHRRRRSPRASSPPTAPRPAGAARRSPPPPPRRATAGARRAVPSMTPLKQRPPTVTRR